jgi:hypothetical protein
MIEKRKQLAKPKPKQNPQNFKRKANKKVTPS